MVCSIITISENPTPKNSCKDESSVQLWEARVPDISFHTWSAAQTWSVSQKERHLDISQTSTKHLTFYLPFGCTHVKQELIPNPIPNSKFQNLSKAQEQLHLQETWSKSAFKYSTMREGNKMHIYSLRVK